jgi:ectoine hydroxylase-related dioxygenase (phytanoyl-CoA dioxygenase family)
MMIANPSSPRTFLVDNGYVYLSKDEVRIPDKMLREAASRVERDVLELQEKEEDSHQEQPIDLLKAKTTKALMKIKKWVLKNVIHPRFSKDAHVPDSWNQQQTMYGRVKKRNEFTRPHCDAYNTIVKRKLVDHDDSTKLFIADELPIYTVWIPLVDMCPRFSHLRVQPRTHKLPNIAFVDEFKGVTPQGYKPLSRNFVRPKSAYRAGDVVIFHCLTQHDATSHRAQKGYRVSMDFRMLMKIDLDGDGDDIVRSAKRRRVEEN